MQERTSPTELVMHPVRLQILRSFLGGRELTTGELRARLPDVPPASLYRHVAALHDGGALAVARERPVRGGVERTYRLGPEAALLSEDGMRGLQPGQRRALFTAFLADVAARVDDRIEHLDADEVSFGHVAFRATDEELRELSRRIQALIAEVDDRSAGTARPRRSLATVLYTDPLEESTDESAQ
ncbi:helix-turn-helix domain-containing protein [Zhihengliuella sp.]|uniref:helix-turn-helix domain-containing protein n=1 Tax=Zhihengliuella sp. TaxID=1954483 RepID=UPI0028123B60|nr:helix-turn-helix domain-containing protein [Zhihengliuella sp.]